MLWKHDIEVLVVGAGPVGLFSALTLAERGLRVEVIDEASESASRNYALLLQPKTLELFDDLGLAEGLIADAPHVETLGVYRSGERIREVPLAPMSQRFPFLVPIAYDRLVHHLEEGLSKREIPVLRRHRLATFEQAANAVRVEVERIAPVPVGYGGARSEWTVEQTLSAKVSFILASEGIRSATRPRLGITFPPFASTQNAALFEFESSADPIDEVRLLYHQGLENILWPLGNGRYRFMAEMREPLPGNSSLALLMGEETFRHLGKETLERLLEERLPEMAGTIGSISWGSEVRFEKRRASEMGRGRVFLAGDAAHLLPPSLAWSVNLGFQEGADLAWRLDAALRRGAPLASLDEYNARWASEALHFSHEVERNPESGMPAHFMTAL